ncbi:MAG: hypothetical protein LBI62_00870, partial [Candidatus Accumulibacter sp.]|nr:hypothetical protein [Accumulibacter sp.]
VTATFGAITNHDFGSVVVGRDNETLGDQVIGTTDGSGTVILHGNNTYKGNTQIKTGGKLEITGTLGYGAGENNYGGDIINDGELTFNQGDSVHQTLSGDISGDGSLTKNGKSTLTFAGTLGKDDGNVFNGSILFNDGTLVFDQADDVKQTITYGIRGILNNDSTLIKRGSDSSVLTLGGTSELGTVEVQKGTLAVSGNLATRNLFLYGGTTVKNDETISFDQLDVHGYLHGANDITNASYAPARYDGRLTVSSASVTMNFYVPRDYDPFSVQDQGAPDFANIALLAIDGTADIGTTDTTVINLAIAGEADTNMLEKGNRIVLIHATDELSGSARAAGEDDKQLAPGMNPTTGKGKLGSLHVFDFNLTYADEDGHEHSQNSGGNIRALLATTDNITLDADKGRSVVDGGILPGVGQINHGLDLITDLFEKRDAYSRNVFAIADGGNSRYRNGPRIDGLNQIAGIVGNTRVGENPLAIGAFVTHGEGKYGIAHGEPKVKAKGETEYIGVGLIARLDLTSVGTEDDHPYLEASLQGGRMRTGFNSSDIEDPITKRGAKYETRAAYAAAHVGVGYEWKLDELSRLSVYGKYLHTYRADDEARMNSGEKVRFDTVESQRLRVGSRYEWTVNELRPYVGVAWEHEFGGSSTPRISSGLGQESLVETTSIKGGTGIIEAGLTLSPSSGSPWSFDFGIQGTIGQREGVSGTFKMEYKF